jgi:hypothetical protein
VWTGDLPAYSFECIVYTWQQALAGNSKWNQES